MRPLVCVLFTLLCAAFTARADVSQSADTTRVYVGNGQMLTVTAARQLSLNAFVGQVLYQPGSLEAAYTGLTLSGDTTTTWVRLVGLRTGETTTLLSTTGPADGDNTPTAYKLEGWSGDGRFLVVSHMDYAGIINPRRGNGTVVCDSVDVGVVPPKVRRLALPEQTGPQGTAQGELLPSPSGNLYALTWHTRTSSQTPAVSWAFLYDPSKDTLRRVPLPPDALATDWADEHTLKVLVTTPPTPRLTAVSVADGREVPARKLEARPAPVPRRFPEVTLSLSPVTLDIPGPTPQSHAFGSSLWLRITGKRLKLPAVCLATFTGNDDPNPVLAPDQSSALWLSRGDLFLSRFSVDAATVREKYDNGEALSCDEERQIAEGNAKQIGLGLIQYAQDYDEQFPPAANFHDGVYPYIKSEGLFGVRNIPFQYAAPADLHMSALDDVSHTVLGTVRLPCAVVTLYADGHVKSEPPAAPGTLSP